MDTLPRSTRCQISQVGKSRSGKPRWWCAVHQAPATGRYGARLEECESAHLDTDNQDCLALEPSRYKGGIGIWGAVSPIFNTSGRKEKPGVHVHARISPDSDKKAIDKTFDAVSMTARRDLLEDRKITITQEAAVSYYVSQFVGHSPKYLFCVHCGAVHLDSGYYAIRPHKRHLCHACGRIFLDTEKSVSNPIVYFRTLSESFEARRNISPAGRSLDIKQEDYPGGIQIWASNPALVWTAERSEEKGIHIHAFIDKDGNPDIDETYSHVKIDGIELDFNQVAHLMAQRTLEFLANKIVSLVCPICSYRHFDSEMDGFQPHKRHICVSCGGEFDTPGRRKLVVGNPLVEKLVELESTWRSMKKEEK